MLGATCAFVGMAAFVKLLREAGMDTSSVMFWRTAPGLLWVVVELRLRRLPLRPKRPGVIVWRCLFGITAMAGYFFALPALSLIQNQILHLLQPVFVAALAPFLLRERLRGLALVALGVAVAGAWISLRPGSSELEAPMWAAGIGMAAALFSALAHMMVRKATAEDSPELVVLSFGVAVTVVSGIAAAATGSLFSMPAGAAPTTVVWWVLGMAGLGLAGQLLMTRAYGRADAPAVAVVAYGAVPLSIVLDWLVWGAGVGVPALAGAALMLGAGILLTRKPRAVEA